MKRAVVTGPTGVVGVNLINELIAHNVSVAAVVRPHSARLGNIPAHPLVETVECPLEQMELLPSLLAGDCDAFYHLAWDGTYGAARTDTARQLQNVQHALEAVRAAKALGCGAFIFAGSQAEYGTVFGRLSPDAPCSPDTAYGQAKLAAGHESRALCQALGVRYCHCRILSLFGPFDGAHTMVMQAVDTMLSGERFPCTAGEQIWDYLYAKDAARAFRLVGERGRDGAVYCLGSGTTRRLRDYITAIRDAIDPALPIGFGERAYYPHQAMHLEADITNLTADTGFLPAYTFEQGIAETVAWVRAGRDVPPTA